MEAVRTATDYQIIATYFLGIIAFNFCRKPEKDSFSYSADIAHMPGTALGI
jgi:hypothetical protein